MNISTHVDSDNGSTVLNIKREKKARLVMLFVTYHPSSVLLPIRTLS
jgi:hypothetical protein